MYLKTIPDYELDDDEDDEPTGLAKTSKDFGNNEVKIVNLFDYARGNV